MVTEMSATAQAAADLIPGWFDFTDVYDDAIELAKHGETLVEVGSWFGKSSAYLGTKCKESCAIVQASVLDVTMNRTVLRAGRPKAGKSLALLCVDTWRGTPDGAHPTLAPIVAQYGGDILPHWRANMQTAGCADYVAAWRGESVKVALELQRGSQRFPFVFLDDDHSLQAVREGVRAWWPLVREGGMLGGHDYDRKPSVKRAVIERFGSRVEERKPRSWTVRKAARKADRIAGLCAAINFGDDRWTIERLIDSVAPHVAGVVARQTAHSYNAVGALRDACKAHSLPLVIELGAMWKDYATDQNALLEAAKRASYRWAFVLDADEELARGDGLRAAFDSASPAAFDVCRLYSADWEVWTPRIFDLRNSPMAAYQGVRHAAPCVHGEIKRLEGVDVIHWGDDGREADKARFARDYEYFNNTSRDTSQSCHVDSRAVYYAAQSAKDAGMTKEAIHCYLRRLARPYGFDEERYESARQLFHLTGESQYLWTAIDLRPHRFEARIALSKWLRAQGAVKRALQVIKPCETMPTSGDRFLVHRPSELYLWAEELQIVRAELASKGIKESEIQDA